MDIDFLVNWWFIAFCLFGVFAAVKGNDYYGYRSACFTFYAMTENETQFNSFLFNACLRNAVCVAVVLIVVLNLPDYAGNSQVGFLMAKVNGAHSFGKIAGVSFFIYILLLMSTFTLIGLFIKGANRIRYGDEFKKN